LSYGNSNRAFGEKSVKKKKQDFHKHKIRPAETPNNHDLNLLKDRTMISLVHLGEQRFSEEPGAYSLDNWMKTFNLLLDDFEDQAGPENLSEDYYTKRLEVSSLLAKSMQPSPELDSEISKLREEELGLRNSIVATKEKSKAAKESEERKDRIKSLEAEKDRNLELFEKAKNSVAHKKKEIQDSLKWSRRIFGGSKPMNGISLQTLQERVSELQTRIEGIEKKISEQRKKLEFIESTNSSDLEGASEELQVKLDELNLKLEELDSKKLEESQLLEQRKQATNAMREQISKLSVRQQASVQPIG
jgi:DNA repair exonuclease SbcCD ATPase subunit